MGINYVTGSGYEYIDSSYSYDRNSFNVHAWNIQHSSLEDVERGFNNTMDTSDALADGLVEVSGNIKEANQVARRKGQKAFDTIDATSDAIEDIQEKAIQDTQNELNEFFNGVANA